MSPMPCSTAATRSCSPRRPASAPTRWMLWRPMGGGIIEAAPSMTGPVLPRPPMRARDHRRRHRPGGGRGRGGVGASALVAFTMTGETARRRPGPVADTTAAFTTESATRSQLALTGRRNLPRPVRRAHRRHGPPGRRALLEITRCQVGDLVVMVAGSRRATPGRTNALRVHRIGDAIEPEPSYPCPRESSGRMNVRS